MEKVDFTFWLNFGLSPNFGLSERVVHKVKLPIVWWSISGRSLKTNTSP